MKSSKLVLVFVVLAFVALGGCKKKEGEGGGGTAGEGGGGGAKEMTAEEFYKDFSGLSGMDALNKYKDGVTVSGTVLRTGEEMDGSMFVHVDAGGGKWVALTFTDKGAAAKGKGIKQGDPIKAECKVGGMADNYVMNTDCTMK